MLLAAIKKLFSNTVYIQLREEKIRICNVDTGTIYEQRPYIAIDKANPKGQVVQAIGNEAFKLLKNNRYEVTNPFSHPRLLVASFVKAEKILMHGIREVHKNRFFAPSPLVIMHPLEKLEGGITDIECRVYRELALGARAREVHVHVGPTLPIVNFSLDMVRAPEAM